MRYEVWFGSFSDRGIHEDFYNILSLECETREEAIKDKERLEKIGLRAWIDEFEEDED